MNAAAESEITRESEIQTTTDDRAAARPSVVDAVFDAVLGWIDAGLGYVKLSLVTGARAMEKSAASVDEVRAKLRPST